MNFNFFGVALILMGAYPSEAHLQAGSLKPSGGENLKIGTTVNIEWIASQAHDGKYDIYFSKDGGKTYPLEIAGPWQGSTTNGAKNIYRWPVPADMATTQGRFRICQLFGGHCVQPGTYMMDSPADFTVSSGTGINSDGKTGYLQPSIQFSQEMKSVEVVFSLAESREVSLKVLDMQGKLVAELMHGKKDAGIHRFSVFSSQLITTGTVLFKLEMGSDVFTQVWTGL